MSNDLLVVKDAQPVAFERSAASGYRYSLNLGQHWYDPDLVQLGL